MMYASGQKQIEGYVQMGSAGITATLLLIIHNEKSRQWKGSILKRIDSTQHKRDYLGDVLGMKLQNALHKKNLGVPKSWRRMHP